MHSSIVVDDEWLSIHSPVGSLTDDGDELMMSTDLVLVVDDERPLALHAAAVAHLAFTGAHALRLVYLSTRHTHINYEIHIHLPVKTIFHICNEKYSIT